MLGQAPDHVGAVGTGQDGVGAVLERDDAQRTVADVGDATARRVDSGVDNGTLRGYVPRAAVVPYQRPSTAATTVRTAVSVA